MSSRRSAVDWLTRDGRTRRRWVAAAAEPDPVTALAGLYEVLDDIDRRPAGCWPWWPEFLTSVTDPRLVGLLTPADLRRLRDVGERVAEASGELLSVPRAWLPLADAHAARGETREATRLLVAIYHGCDVEDARADVAGRLARHGRTADPELAVYFDCLRGPAPHAVKVAVRRTIAAALRVGVDTADARIRRARDIAGQLRQAGITEPKPQRALGFHDLLVDGRPRSAATHLEAAHAADPDDIDVLVGLLAALLRTGDHARIAALNEETSPRDGGRVAGLIRLSRVLSWLDDPDTDGAPPADAATLLAGAGIPAGEWLPYAVARLQLLAGEAAQAAETLCTLARAHPEHPSWWYHAAWAAALSGDRTGVADLYTAAADSPDRWTVACVLLDADPETAVRMGIGAAAQQATSWGTEVFAARLRAGTRGPRDPRVAVPQDDPGQPITHRLERLRIDLGCRFARDGGAALAQPLASGLFHRLPRAERLLWRGLRVLADDPRRGTSLLQDAAYPRAALILAVHHLERHDLDAAGVALRRLAWRDDTTVTLLRAWAGACSTAPADPIDRLEQLAATGEARAHYMLGNLHLEKDAAVAAGHFSAALTSGSGAVPADTAVLARCAAAAATGAMPTGAMPAGGMTAGGAPPVVERPIPGRAAWVRWMLTVGRLADDPASVDVAACAEIVHALEHAGPGPDAVVAAVVDLLIRACVHARERQRVDAFRALVHRLAPPDSPARARLEELRLAVSWRDRLAGRGPAARREAARLTDGGAAPALVAAEVWLRSGETAAALRVLRQVPRDAPAHRLVEALVSTLDGADLPGTLEEPGDAPATASGLRLLHAARLARSAPEQCVELLAHADRDLTRVVDLRPVLGWWSARNVRARTVPQPLRQAVRSLAERPALEVDQLLLARCATAIREIGTADTVWSRLMIGSSRPDEMRGEYARFLSHRAATTRQAGGDAAGFVGLAALWDVDGSVPAGLAQRTVLADLVGRLVGFRFPRVVVRQQDLGRYRVLAGVVEQNSALIRALTARNRAAARAAWDERLPAHADAVELQHALAVLYREDALAAVAADEPAAVPLTHATTLWMSLLRSPAFWRRHPAAGTPRRRPEEIAALTRAVTTELLGLHMAAGNRDLAAGRTAAETTTAALIVEIARDVQAAWCAQLLRDAERTLLDPEAIGRLPDGVDKDYAGAISDLDRLTATEPAPQVLLVAALNWYNDWGHRLYLRQEPDQLRAVLVPARLLADRLAAGCVEGVGHLPANRALCAHLVLRGWLSDADDQGEAELRAALRWNPADRNAAGLLDQAIELARSQRVRRLCAAAEEAEREQRLDDASAALRGALAEAVDAAERDTVRRMIDGLEVRAATQRLTSSLQSGPGAPGALEALVDRLVAEGANAADRQRRREVFSTTLNNRGVALINDADTAAAPFRTAFQDLQDGRRSAPASATGIVIDSQGVATMPQECRCGVCGVSQATVLEAIRVKPAAKTFRGTDVLRFWNLLRPHLCTRCLNEMDRIVTSRHEACRVLAKAVKLAPDDAAVRANLAAATAVAGLPVTERPR